MQGVVHFSEEGLSKQITVGVTVVDFWATWCAPCRMVAPVFEGVAEKMQGKAVFGKVNVDDEEGLAIRYGISAIPTMLVFKNGEVVAKHVGLIDEERLEKLVEGVL